MGEMRTNGGKGRTGTGWKSMTRDDYKIMAG